MALLSRTLSPRTPLNILRRTSIYTIILSSSSEISNLSIQSRYQYLSTLRPSNVAIPLKLKCNDRNIFWGKRLSSVVASPKKASRARSKIRWVRNGVGLLLFYYVYSHYEKVPASERMRFVFTKPSIYWENGFSKKMYWDLLEMYEQLEEEVVSLTDPTFRRVENVLSDILDANDLGILMDSSKKPRKTASKNSKGEEGLREWRLIIIKDDNIKNAMAARGLIIVFTGVLNILPKDDNNNALAALLGHEVAHVVLSHASERLNSAIAFGIVSLVIMGYIDISTISQLISYVFGSHYTYKNLYEELYTLPNKRSAEHEADILGMKLAAQACYDPKGAVTLQKRLDEYEKEVIQKIGNKNKNPDPEYRRTHPKGEHRIDQLNANLPEAISLRTASDYCSNGFIQSLKFWRS